MVYAKRTTWRKWQMVYAQIQKQRSRESQVQGIQEQEIQEANATKEFPKIGKAGEVHSSRHFPTILSLGLVHTLSAFETWILSEAFGSLNSFSNFLRNEVTQPSFIEIELHKTRTNFFVFFTFVH